MEETATETLPKRPGFWKKVGDLFQIESRDVDTKSPQPWHVLRTLAAVSTLEGNLFQDSYNLFTRKLKERTNYPWEDKSTPPKLQDAEYSLLTLFMTEKFLPDLKTKKMGELVSYSEDQLDESIQNIKDNMIEKRQFLWEKFCQENKLNPEDRSHLDLIQKQASDLSFALHQAEDNPSKTAIALTDAFKNIQNNREALLAPSIT